MASSLRLIEPKIHQKSTSSHDNSPILSPSGEPDSCHQCSLPPVLWRVWSLGSGRFLSWVQLRKLHLHLFSSATRFLANLCFFLGGFGVFSVAATTQTRPKTPKKRELTFWDLKKGRDDFSSSSLARFAHLFHNFSEVARTQTSNHRSSFVSDNVKVHCPVQTKCRKKEHNLWMGSLSC